MKKLKTIFMILAMTLVLFACKRADVKAATDNGVSVNVPSKMDIIFNEDGTTSVKDMYLENDSLVPVELQNINIKEFNDWEIVPKSHEILVNSKQVSLQMGDKELVAGTNVINREVAEGEKYELDVTVNRGAWTETVAPEKAMELELEYQIGKKQFVLTLDGNGYEVIETVNAVNGQPITLPKPVREGYELAGWQDEDGNVYNGVYYMPIGDVTLKAVWKKQVAYALFTATDGYLTFVKTANAIQKGQTYNGKTITSVYTGFEEAKYTSASQVPWYADGTYKNIKRVIIQDKIKPVSTAYWFYECEQCMRFEMKNLDTSKVTSMEWMYYLTGRNKETAYVITGMDTWDTSQVTNMLGLFEGSGIYVSMFDIGDVGKWNVSKVTDMRRMFSAAGMRATNVYIGDLSNWDTRSLTQTVYMFEHFAWQTPSINIGNIGNWNVSNVTNMYSMFSHFGEYSDSVYMGNLSNWNVSKVTDFGCMFYWCAMYVPNWNFGNLGNWNVSSGQMFSSMFSNAGNHSKTFYVGSLQNWNTANATNMGHMFSGAGESASWSLNCRNWNVKKVDYYVNFDKYVESKVTEPVWVN